MKFLRSALMVVTMMVAMCAALSAQHWQGNCHYNNTANGPMDISLTLNNSDSSDIGIGSIDKVNGTKMNTPIYWRRNTDTDDIEIFADEARTNKLGTLKKCPRNQAVSSPPTPSGSCELNDQNPPSTGDYFRQS